MFENDQWKVTGFGLETVKENSDNRLPPQYFIPSDKLTKITLRGEDTYYAYIVDVAEKTWVSVPSLIEAFGEALHHHSVEFDHNVLEASINEALRISSR